MTGSLGKERELMNKTTKRTVYDIYDCRGGVNYLFCLKYDTDDFGICSSKSITTTDNEDLRVEMTLKQLEELAVCIQEVLAEEKKNGNRTTDENTSIG
jgi:hypothetical protein